jgi:hypothetical protein
VIGDRRIGDRGIGDRGTGDRGTGIVNRRRLLLGTLITTVASVVALPLLATAALADDGSSAAAGPCPDSSVALTVEEQRLTASPAPGEPAVGPELIRLGGFDPLVSGFVTRLCAVRTPAAARVLVAAGGTALWRTAVARAQGHRPGMGTLDRYDDRPLYWARLRMSAALRQWVPRFRLDPAVRADLLTSLDHRSRGLDPAVPAVPGPRSIMVSGFDPFQLDGPGVRISNPSGAAALQLDGRILRTANGPVLVHAVTFPVVWDYFDTGIVEAAYGTALRDPRRRPGLVMTISQGRPGRFDIERWAGDWRGGEPDNNDAVACGPVPPAAGWPQPAGQFIETTLPVGPMLGTGGGAYPVEFNQTFCVWPDPASPGTGTAQCRSDAPRPGEVAAQGSGGDYLSNESMYRANRVRLGLGATAVPGGHLHTPVLGVPDAPTTLTDTAFEARRRAIADQVVALATAAAGSVPDPR